MALKTGKDVLKFIADNDIKYVDLRFTDIKGKWQHVTFDLALVDDDFFAEGQMFDGSSIAGWKSINVRHAPAAGSGNGPDPPVLCAPPFLHLLQRA